MGKNVLIDTVDIYNNRIVFTFKEINAFGIIDIENGHIKYFSGPKQEMPFRDKLYGGIKLWNDEIIFIPHNAGKIWIFSLVSNEWIDIDIRRYTRNIRDSLFCGADIYEDYIYMFGYKVNDILCLNLKTLGINWLNLKNDNHAREMSARPSFWGQNFVKYNDELFVGSSNGMLFKLNLKTGVYDWIDLGIRDRVVGVELIDEILWCATFNSRELIKMHLKGKIEKVAIPYQMKIWGICYCNNSLLLYHPNYNTVLFDPIECTFKTEDYKSCMSFRKDKYGTVILKEDNIVYIDEENIEHDYKINIFEEKHILSNLKLSSSIQEWPVIEKEVFGLKDFIEFV